MLLLDDAASEGGKSGVPDRPSEHFHRRVLDRLPTALIVVDDSGTIVYGNEALEKILGIPSAEGVGTGIFEYIHPDDLSWLAEAFVMIADRNNHDAEVVNRPWTPLHFRLIARSGAVVPVEVTGNGSLHDPDVNGVIYEVRLAYERDIVQSVLAGVASGGELTGQLELVIDLISASTINIDSAILRVSNVRTEVLAVRNDRLRATLARAADTGELSVFTTARDTPQFHDVAAMPTGLSSDLAEHGYKDAWNLDVASIADDSTYRIVGFTEIHQVPAMGVCDRLAQAAELTSVILLRIHHEHLLDQAAHNDALTDLPNRVGLRRLIDRMPLDRSSLAVLFIDLDGFKCINDEHGHQTGDQVLKTVARRLTAATGPDDLVARLGGDEFAVVLAPPSDQALDAQAISNRLIATIETPLIINGQPAAVSASLGLVEMKPGIDLDTAIGAADRAMYHAKRAGGGQMRRCTLIG